jgi:16S rRNA (cytosine1402-N4)-methyltransferase
MSDHHQPVLLQEVIEYLAIKPEGFYVDATFGRGGHSREILNRLQKNGLLIAIDKDADAIKFAQFHFKGNENFIIKQGSFSMLQSLITELGLTHKINGILLDLGVSSPQLDEPARGFSFLQDGPLDMRMDATSSLDATTWINTASEEEIATVLKEYGEERYAKRIARSIVLQRAEQPITRTLQLAAIVSKANPAWEKHKHPATRSFQAIRIFINRELDELKECLDQCLEVLAVGGRLAVISFHSLEDRIVKKFIQKHQRGDDFPPGLPVTSDQLSPKLKRIAWGITASELEINNNPRARSAVLRVAEKLK